MGPGVKIDSAAFSRRDGGGVSHDASSLQRRAGKTSSSASSRRQVRQGDLGRLPRLQGHERRDRRPSSAPSSARPASSTASSRTRSSSRRSRARALERQARTTCLKGMTGIAWSYEDPSAAAKVVKAFRRTSERREAQGQGGARRRARSSTRKAVERPARDHARQGRAPRDAARHVPGAARSSSSCCSGPRSELRLPARRQGAARRAKS